MDCHTREEVTKHGLYRRSNIGQSFLFSISIKARGDQYSEFHHREWEMYGIEMNRFAARWYDPTIARWHAPDPLEQMHSPYVALCGDPANFVDPDGRAGIHLCDWDRQNIIGFASVIAGGAAMVGIGQALSGLSAVSQTFQAIRGPLSIISSISSGVSLIKGVSSMTSSFGAGNRVSDAWMDDMMGEMRSHGHTGLAYYGQQSGSLNGVSNKKKDPIGIKWSRVTREDGSFMGNMIWMDGTTGLQNGQNVDMFLYYSMHKLQSDHNREISGYLIQDGKGNLGYFIEDWSQNIESKSYPIPEVTLRSPNGFSRNKEGSNIKIGSSSYAILAIVHTHPTKVYVKGAPSEFANTPSEEDAFIAGDGSIPNYVLGPDFISRVSGRDAGSVSFNTMPTDSNGNVIKFTPDYYKIAELYEMNTGHFRISEDALVRQKRRQINGKK